MIVRQLQKIINGGEGLTVEFKECRSRVNRDVYESICAFLNRNGGHIILGVRNLFKYTRNYSGGVDPQLIEADIFRIVIPTPQATPQDIVSRMVAFCSTARTAKEMMDYLGLKDRKHFRTEVLNPLINQKKLAMKFPDKHRSPKQKYYSLKSIDCAD